MQIPAILHKSEDGSFLLEILHPDWRIGIIVDRLPTDSGYYFVSKDHDIEHIQGDITKSEELFAALEKVYNEKSA